MMCAVPVVKSAVVIGMNGTVIANGKVIAKAVELIARNAGLIAKSGEKTAQIVTVIAIEVKGVWIIGAA